MYTKINKEVEELVSKELALANENFTEFHSRHEAYAVIKEEYEELNSECDKVFSSLCDYWYSTKSDEQWPLNDYLLDTKKAAISAACEAIQVAAMCCKATALEQAEEEKRKVKEREADKWKQF